jgi:hypothetical protein
VVNYYRVLKEDMVTYSEASARYFPRRTWEKNDGLSEINWFPDFESETFRKQCKNFSHSTMMFGFRMDTE